MACQEDQPEPAGHVGLLRSVSYFLQRIFHFTDSSSSFIGTILLMTVPSETKAQHIGLLISYYITLSFWSAQTLALSMISRNIAGQTKKTVAVATNFIVWAAGNAIGKSISSRGNASLTSFYRTTSVLGLGRPEILHRLFHPLGLLRAACDRYCRTEVAPTQGEQEKR